jgi:hemerythrin superfamily protein
MPVSPAKVSPPKKKTAKSKAPDAIALLKADHKKVAGLFESYEKSRGRKAEIAQQICLELLVHTTIEEEILYPACKGVVEDDLLDESYVEHDGAKMLIAEVETGSPIEPFYDAKVKVLSEDIEHHVKEEEKPNGLFAQLRKGDVDLNALGAKMQARKKELMAQMKGKALPMPMTRTMTGAKVELGSVTV